MANDDRNKMNREREEAEQGTNFFRKNNQPGTDQNRGSQQPNQQNQPSQNREMEEEEKKLNSVRKPPNSQT